MPRKTKAEKDQEALERETALNTTKDKILVRAGQMWKDLNPRSDGRLISVSDVKSGVVTLYDGKRTGTLSVSRMYPHSRGYELVGSA